MELLMVGLLYMGGPQGLAADDGPEIVVLQPSGAEAESGVGTVNFGTVRADSSASLSYTIKNTGTADLTDLTITQSGTYASNYVVTQSPLAPLAPGASTTLTIQFIPTVYGVNHPATLSIASNDADENPFDLRLRGASPQPRLTVIAGGHTGRGGDYLFYDFGTTNFGESKSMTFVVKNEGGGNMTGIRKGLQYSGSNGFVMTEAPESTDVVAPGESTPVTVQFTPVRGGLHGERLRISVGMDFVEIYLSGNAQAPEIMVSNPDFSIYQDGGSYDFGQVHGKDGTKTFTIKNTGVEDLTGLAASLDGAHAADFELSWNPPYTTSLSPGESAALTVNFKASAPGQRTSALHITSNDADETPFDIALSASGSAAIQVQRPSLYGPPWMAVEEGGGVTFPLQHPGEEQSITLRILNTGIVALTGLATALDGEHSEVYQITQDVPVSTLAPGEMTTVTLTVKPVTTGTFLAALHITSSDPNATTAHVPMGVTATLPDIQVWGSGAEIPQGGVLDFGPSGYPLSYRELDIGILNVGIGGMIIKSYVLGGQDPNDFYMERRSYSSFVGEGLAQLLTVRFIPRGTGTRTATLKIVTNDPDEAEYEITLRGASELPGLQVEEPVHVLMMRGDERAFMTATADTVGLRERTFTIRNTGVNPLTLGQMTISGTEQHFTVISPPAAEVPPSGTTTFTVAFTPKAAGNLSAELSINNNSGLGPFNIQLKGQSIATRIGFEGALFTATQGDREARVVIKRSLPGLGEASVRLSTVALEASDLPPFSRAEANLDYQHLSAQLVTFAPGETGKVVSVPLLPNPSRGRVNRHLRVKLTDVSPAGTTVLDNSIGAIHILAKDSTKPTLTLLTPAAGRMPAPETLEVSGKMGDALGIREVTVALNGGSPVPAIPSPANEQDQDPKDMRFSLMITPALGPNELVVTATDLKGNTTTVRRSFTAVRRQTLTFRAVEAGQFTVSSLGSITSTITPAGSASSVTTTAGVKTASVDAGAIVELKMTPKDGYAMTRWSTLDSHELPLSYHGNTVRFKMPDRTVEVLAHLVPTPFTPPLGETNQWHWRLHSDDAGGLSTVATEGYLTGTLTAAGSFSGKLLMNGRSQPVTATLHGTGQALFTVGAVKQDVLPLPDDGQLRMQFDPTTGGIEISIIHQTGSSSAQGRRAVYSSTSKVPAALLNAPTKGTYTLRFNLVAPAPVEMSPALYPQASGYATMTLLNTGTVTLTGVLADGTPVTMSTPLLAGNEAPLFVQLPTPGATTKLGLVTGLLQFDNAPATTDVTSDLTWFRPAAATPKVLLYNAGWPAGISLDAEGALYSATKSFQSALFPGLTANTTSPARLHFTGGTLASEMVKTSFGLKANTVVKTTPVDNTYTLAITPASGFFSGTFTPNWSNPGSAKPAFKGVILQKGTATAAGFFISNAKSPSVPETGSVTLGAPVP